MAPKVKFSRRIVSAVTLHLTPRAPSLKTWVRHLGLALPMSTVNSHQEVFPAVTLRWIFLEHEAL